MKQEINGALGTGTSVVVDHCQICASTDLEPVLFLGYLPPVNTMRPVGTQPHEEYAYPAQLLHCQRCHLVQLGLIVDANILFPPEYPYTSGTTKVLCENFAELYSECRSLVPLTAEDLVVDIGSNDGTLLSNFAKNHRVQGITPEQVGHVAIKRGIPTLISYFTPDAVAQVRKENGQAKIITATNVFAHIEKPHEVVESITDLLAPEGVFISESHYLVPLLETVQYDTIYHEHLRYYSLHSIKYLLDRHGFEVFHAKRIPTHGGSIRVYACRKGQHAVRATVAALLKAETDMGLNGGALSQFAKRVVVSKLALNNLLLQIKERGERIYGVGAPSRASTLINYVGLDDGIMDCVVEVKGSHKIGKYIPGKLIPVVEETKLFADQPEYAMLLSWHIADELMPKLVRNGFRGDFIIPLPTPRVVRHAAVASANAA